MSDVPGPNRRDSARRVALGLLVVMATLGCCIVGVANQKPTIRAIAAVATVVLMAGSLALARKRGNLIGWYVVAIGTTVLRVLSDL